MATTRERRRFEALVVKLRMDDIVHNEVTNEEGRIVRIVKVNGRLGYVVVKATKPFAKEIEALWRPRELKEVRNRVQKRIP